MNEDCGATHRLMLPLFAKQGDELFQTARLIKLLYTLVNCSSSPTDLLSVATTLRK